MPARVMTFERERKGVEVNMFRKPKAQSAWLIAVGAVLLVVLASLGSVAGGPAPQITPRPANAPHADQYAGAEICSTCHSAEFEQLKKTYMSVLLTEKFPIEQRGCESCHGPAKAHADGMMEGNSDAVSLVYSFSRHTPKENSGRCLMCHQKDEARSQFHRSRHLAAGLACNDCHSPHRLFEGEAEKPPAALQAMFTSSSRPAEQQWLDNRLLKDNESSLCTTCHRDVAAQFQLPVRHRVNEGMVKCSDCHNTHGSLDRKELRGAQADQVCYSCHVEKKGPFVYEHAPVRVEGCTSCHTPHGSTNLHLLVRRQERQLCLECHVSPQGTNVPHPRLSFQAAGECTRCHTEIHGSNYQPEFLR